LTFAVSFFIYHKKISFHLGYFNWYLLRCRKRNNNMFQLYWVLWLTFLTLIILLRFTQQKHDDAYTNYKSGLLSNRGTQNVNSLSPPSSLLLDGNCELTRHTIAFYRLIPLPLSLVNTNLLQFFIRVLSLKST